MYLALQTFLVFGLSQSGRSATEFLLSQKAKVYVYDDLTNERIDQTADELQKKGAIRVLKEELEKMPDICDVLVLSPGIAIDHPLAVTFKRRGKAVIGETELAVRFMRCPIIAVTGTNGKTTTVTMLSEVLKNNGFSVRSCGNIGAPMVDFCDMGKEEIAVAEISSFQMETLQSICPHIAVILNITEDHLNRHYTMENYVFLKGRLLKNCTQSEYAVLNYDDKIVRSFAEKTKAKVLFFSLRERVNGAFYENGDLYFGKEKIMSSDDLSVGGLHNVQNALAVIAVAKLMRVPSAVIAQALSSFKGVKHRLEAVGVIDGVTYIDDSKGTNVDATMKAVSSLKAETVLLLGGKDKGYLYDKLFTALKDSKVIHVVLYGENRFKLLQSAREKAFLSLTLCDTFAFAVEVASLKAKAGQIVLLSPASASFDEFSNYEERGDAFAKIVRSFQSINSIKETVEEEDIEQEERKDRIFKELDEEQE